ncbi:MAG: hypothetical protein M3464_20510 [Chloroflexota bacterium]|nr:hypothetical protein [Chloroflexota bacterium]
MQAERTMSGLRNLGFVAMLAVGLVLGAAVPVVADSGTTDIATVCGVDEVTAVEASEWAAPPSPGWPGEPY